MNRTRHPSRLLAGAAFFLLLLVLALPAGSSLAQTTPESVTIAGTVQGRLGCSDNWQPSCEATFLAFDETTGLWTGTFELTAGSYEYKVAIDGAWGENYGAGGVLDGPNVPLLVAADGPVTFTYDPVTHIVTDSTGGGLVPELISADVAQPATVTIPGTIQSVLGCPGDWQPDCENTFLALGDDDEIWTGTFALPAGDYEYKAAINGAWDENYGLNAQAGGSNIPLSLAEDREVTFYYDHRTNWVTDDVNSLIPIVIGDFQDELGCPADSDAACLRTWLQNADGDATYAIATTAAVAPGTYSAQLILGQDAANSVGDPVAFTVEAETALYFEFDADAQALSVSTEGAPKGNLGESRAHWVARDLVAWDVDSAEVVSGALHYSADGGLKIDRNGLGGSAIAMTLDPAGLPDDVLAKFPQLAGFEAFRLDPEQLRQVRIALKGQVAVAGLSDSGIVADATGVQIAGVLDDIYAYDGDLGVTVDDGMPVIRVWAPTARLVRLVLFDDANPGTVGQPLLTRVDPDTGVWTISGEADWWGKFYLFEVQVWAPSTKKVETNLVTDPYSVSLSMNSARSQIVDLNAPELLPEGWLDFAKPALAAPEDIVLYELHIRDFSANDETVSEVNRGTYLAFTEGGSNGMRHLAALAQAGLSHIHLLPAFDIATIDEDKSTWDAPTFAELSAFGPADEAQQELVYAARALDGFNWGYDPYHYNVPEGSYSTDPDGGARILEFRQMVQALNQTGLRVVMDVVYNHTNASGQSEKSVLDKVVPGYYYRLSGTGQVERSTCCENTATEHDMMRKLMVDSVVQWAIAYKVDGFRFDLMGHHMKEDMLAVRAALDALTLEEDGVDGQAIYVYGEGWDFGEVAENARGINATQLNMAGTGIGTFSDRLRDAVRGGNPFGGYFEQGFINGLYYDTNSRDTRAAAAQLETLLLFADQIRVGMAGNLADYRFVNASGEEVTGSEILYGGAPAGYTADPQENIIYISAHDNETLFDAIVAKAPQDATMDEIVRMQNMGLSIVALSQGVPFFHAGSDMLRSKSFDRDSYDSGDWFNRLDYSYTSNNFGAGLPPADKNQERWGDMAGPLADPRLLPSSVDITRAAEHLREVVTLRFSTPLFRLQSAADIDARLAYHNTGPDQVPGVIVLSLSDVVGENLDPNYDAVVAVFNATADAQTLTVVDLVGVPLALHPLLVGSTDALVREASFDAGSGTVSVPARTTAVFVASEGSLAADEEQTPADDGAAAPEPQPTAEPAATAAPDDGGEPAGGDTSAAEADSGPGGGLIAGIVVGVLAALGIIGALIFRRRQA